jgi:NADH-quinone oxidoreductase subunit H
VLLLVYLQLAIRWTFPRFRYDQVQTVGWKILLPLGLANVFVTAALVLWDPSLRALALVGMVEVGVLALLTITAPRQVRRAQEEAAAHENHGHGGHGAALPAGTH